MRINRICIAALAALLASAAVAAPAAIAKPRAESKVSARINGFELEGRVRSVDACEPGRTINLIRDSEANGREVVNTTRTNRKGSYSFGQVLFQVDADYYVRAEKRDRSRVICKSDITQVPLN